MMLWQVTTSLVRPSPGDGGYSRKQAAMMAASLFVTLGLVSGGRGAVPWFLDSLVNIGLEAFAWMFDDEDEDDNSLLDVARKHGGATAIEVALRDQSRLLADLWTKGPLSMATGMDLQARLGIQQWPIRIDTGLTFDKNSLGEVLTSFLGPMGSVLGTGLELITELKDTGRVNARTVGNLLPKIVRDAGAGINYARGEGYKDRAGNLLLSNQVMMDAHALLASIIGFTPNVVADLNKARLLQTKADIAFRKRQRNVTAAARRGDVGEAVQMQLDLMLENPSRAVGTGGIANAIKKQMEGDIIRETVTSGLNPDRVLESLELARLMGLERDRQLEEAVAEDEGIDVEGDDTFPGEEDDAILADVLRNED
jgi:hypothetical protein